MTNHYSQVSWCPLIPTTRTWSYRTFYDGNSDFEFSNHFFRLTEFPFWVNIAHIPGSRCTSARPDSKGQCVFPVKKFYQTLEKTKKSEIKNSRHKRWLTCVPKFPDAHLFQRRVPDRTEPFMMGIPISNLLIISFFWQKFPFWVNIAAYTR